MSAFIELLTFADDHLIKSSTLVSTYSLNYSTMEEVRALSFSNTAFAFFPNFC